jgi:hypothetical protein
VPAVSAPPELAFYQSLRRYDFTRPEPQTALAFTRVWADLATRVLAARQAQTGDTCGLPLELLACVFESYLNCGPQELRTCFTTSSAPALPKVHALALELAAWLAPQYNPADPLASSYQAYVQPPGSDLLALYGPPRPEPPRPFKLLAEPPLAPVLDEAARRPIAVIGHYDVHGLAMLALTLRYLRRHGFDEVDCALGFEWTGDIGKLWKRAVPKTVAHEKEYALVVLIDCSIHSRKPEYTLKAIEKLAHTPRCRLALIDHHPDTFTLAPQLLHPQLDLLLTDIPGCGLVDRWDSPERELMLLGAIGDKVPEVCAAFPETDARYCGLHEANRAFHQRAIAFSPTPDEYRHDSEFPLRPLWEALAAGTPPSAQLDAELYGAAAPLAASTAPEVDVCGSLLIVTQPLAEVGRQWYGLLERLMHERGMSYAAALRVLDGKHANILLLTQWNATHLPPVRNFIPDTYGPRLLGHPGATWADLPLDAALPFLAAVTARLNEFMGTPAEFNGLADKLARVFLIPARPGLQPAGF